MSNLPPGTAGSNEHMVKNKILIVEDEPSMLRALHDKFAAEGFEILEARNGESGLAKAKEEHPDIILLDIIMPKMDGLTMLKGLREDKWGAKANVIILTNLSDGESLSTALKHGAYDFLVKADWRLEDVVSKVKEKLKK